MSKTKTYSATYKIIQRGNLKKVSFHGLLLHPLYIQITYNRKSNLYKCNLFDLFLEPRYSIRIMNQVNPPNIEDVIKKEEELIEYIINENAEDFSLGLFKYQYDYLSQDILSAMAPEFLRYITTFFQDEGLPYLADALSAGMANVGIVDVLMDLKSVIPGKLYNKFVENSLVYAPPYYILYQFIQQRIRSSLVCLTIMDWEKFGMKTAFEEFLAISYKTGNLSQIINEIDLAKTSLGPAK